MLSIKVNTPSVPRTELPGLDMSYLPGYIVFAVGYTGCLSLAVALLATVGLQASIKLHNNTLRAVRLAVLLQVITDRSSEWGYCEDALQESCLCVTSSR